MENLSAPFKDIVVIYHANCPDGFGSAWVAHQKFGDTASYIPLKRGEELIDGLEGKEIYMVDFSYSKDSLLQLESIARRFVIIDHHASSQPDVEAVKEHVFELNHSGAYLTWQYFFPEKLIPLAIEYLSAGDIGAFNTLKDQELLEFYVTSTPLTFEAYTLLIEEFATSEGLEKVYSKATVLQEYQNKIIESCYRSVHYVVFEGYTIPAVNACLPISETSKLLYKIYTEHKVPFALRYRYDDGEWKCSLRGDGSVDVSLLAAKHGGGGHRGSAGFIVNALFPLPFATLTETPDILQ